MKYYEDSHCTIYNKDCLDMAEVADNSVDCVVTSPPYWGLRKYAGLPDLVWDSRDGCEHEWGEEMPGRRKRAIIDIKNLQSKEATKSASAFNSTGGNFCQSCGAWRGQLGLEPSIELYLSHLLEIMREVRRVLKPSGVAFLNIADTYLGSSCGYGDYRTKNKQSLSIPEIYGEVKKPQAKIGKPKDLALIPERLAILLQQDGWWVRSIICWEKRNPMPESVAGWRWERHKIKLGNRGRGKEVFHNVIGGQDHDKYGGFLSDAIWQDCPGCEKCLPNDGLILRKGSWRPTSSYENIIMLTKSDTYFCDGESVREPQEMSSLLRLQRKHSGYDPGYPTGPQNHISDYFKKFEGKNINEISNEVGGRNLRDVLSFPTANYPGSHFSVFPEKLPEICILASTPEAGVCSKCGEPWARVIDTKYQPVKYPGGKETPISEPIYRGGKKCDGNEPQSWEFGRARRIDKTLGFRPSCQCQSEAIPATVLDPFMGSGTTLAVAKRLGRKAVGYELSFPYCELARRRIEAETAPMKLI